MKKIFALTALLAVCLTVTSCSDKNSLSEDTAATAQSTEQASETTQTEETAEVTTSETKSLTDLSDYDKAVRLAAEHIEENGADHWKYILYDFDLDGIPELMEETGFMDTGGWEIYKLTGSEAIDLGYMEFSVKIERYDPIYYHGDELTLESGVHIYCDPEKDEIFYVTEYTTELHTDGCAVGSRYDIYADRMTAKELYHCDFLTLDDLGESGNRYITHNILDGKQASPMYRCDCNSEGFLYCNEFGDYLSNFEYLGMIDVENYYSKENGGSFYDYAETVKIPEKTKKERIYTDSGENTDVYVNKYHVGTYESTVVINNDNFDSVDLSELVLRPGVEKLTLVNDSDRTVDISPLSAYTGLTELMFEGGNFDYSPLLEMDNIIWTNAPIEYISQMKSIKIVDVYPYKEEIEDLSLLYDMDELEVVMYSYWYDPETIDTQIDKLSEQRPDLLLIYVP